MKHLLIIFSFIFLGACDFIQTKEKKVDYCNFTGSNYIPRYIEDKDYERAKKEVPEYESIFELWKVLSTYDGDVSSAAIYNIGLSYLKGNNDVNQDFKEAVRWIRKSNWELGIKATLPGIRNCLLSRKMNSIKLLSLDELLEYSFQ